MSTFIIINLNVQSLQAHVGDLQTDKLILKADIIVLTETWLRDPDSIDKADFSRTVSKCCERNEG